MVEASVSSSPRQKRAFKVPIAVDGTGKYHRPDDEPNDAELACPECARRVSARQRRGARRHFYHVADGTGCLFHGGGEGALHAEAKHLLIAVIHGALEGRQRPTLQRTCASCGALGEEVADVLVAHDVRSARGEVVRDVASGRFRADVGLVSSDGSVVFLIEVFSTHKVSTSKARALNVPWVELDASRVLDDGWRWVAIQDGRLGGAVSCQCAGLRVVDVGRSKVACPLMRDGASKTACAACKHFVPARPSEIPGHHRIWCGAPDHVVTAAQRSIEARRLGTKEEQAKKKAEDEARRREREEGRRKEAELKVKREESQRHFVDQLYDLTVLHQAGGITKEQFERARDQLIAARRTPRRSGWS